MLTTKAPHQDQQRFHLAQRATVLAILLSFIFMLLKIISGVFGFSHALVADGLHSGADLLTNLLVLIAARYSHEGPDDDHPYGHQRIETAAAVALAIFLALTGLAIILESVWHLIHVSQIEQPNMWILWIIFLALCANEGLFRYTLKIAIKIQSELLKANAWHARSDAATSLVVLIGVIFSLLGHPKLDNIAAIIVGIMIIKMGWSLGFHSVRELIDTGVDPKLLEQIQQVITNVSGVKNIHDLRTRYMANRVFIDVHVLVDDQISVSEGHYIGDQVIANLYRTQLPIGDVIVHIDSENDETVHLNLALPSREQILLELDKACHDLPGFKDQRDLRLHYLKGTLGVELILSCSLLNSTTVEQLTAQYQQATVGLPFKVEISFKPAQ